MISLVIKKISEKDFNIIESFSRMLYEGKTPKQQLQTQKHHQTLSCIINNPQVFNVGKWKIIED